MHIAIMSLGANVVGSKGVIDKNNRTAMEVTAVSKILCK